VITGKDLARAVVLNVAALIVTGWLVRQWPELRQITNPWSEK
jgi:hypothetical protein